MQNFDLVIIGGGMVGLTLACALKNQAISIAVIDIQAEQRPDDALSGLRVSAINHASKQVLTRLNAWAAINAEQMQAFNRMQVWEADSFASIDFNAKSTHEAQLGYIVQNQAIESALFEQVAKADNIELFMSTECAQILFSERECWLTLRDGRHLTAKLVVACDGANSWLRQQANIPLTFWDYGHTAIVANVETREPHDNCCRQVFSPQGTLAFLPLPHAQQCSIVWSVSPQRAQQLIACSELEFNKELSIAFDNQLGLCSIISERQSFPLKMRYARQFAKARLALCGDAAHTIHPLAGQGVNLGLLDAAALAQQIGLSITLGRDIGELSELRSYERWRKTEALKMIIAMESFKRLFEGNNPLKKIVRNLGLALVDKISLSKSLLLKQAMGLDGELPDLAKKP